MMNFGKLGGLISHKKTIKTLLLIIVNHYSLSEKIIAHETIKYLLKLPFAFYQHLDGPFPESLGAVQ